MNEKPDIFELKAYGHELIDDIVRLGVQRNTVYSRLEENLKVPKGMGHFARMATISQVGKAIVELKAMKKRRKKTLRSRNPKAPPQPSKATLGRRRNVLPILEQKRLLKNHNPFIKEQTLWNVVFNHMKEATRRGRLQFRRGISTAGK